jgi:hypothetical protein
LPEGGDTMTVAGSMITRSVGWGGANQRPDVQRVQTLLNAVPPRQGGPIPLLDVDGLCGPLTCSAIRRFQNVNLGFADGRIDPGRMTAQALVALLDALGLLQKLLKGKPVPPPPKPPPGHGAHSPVRMRVMAVCRQLLPPPGQLTQNKKPKGVSGTGCGGFPGHVFSKVPVIPPGQKGAFKVNVKGAGTCYLTTPMICWEQFAEAVDKQYPPAKTWVPFKGNRPLPGDIYVLGRYEKPAEFQHVGIIVKAQGNEWMTADGGQGQGWQSGFVKRKFHPATGQIDGESGNQAFLRGWVDLDILFTVAIAAFPANL